MKKLNVFLVALFLAVAVAPQAVFSAPAVVQTQTIPDALLASILEAISEDTGTSVSDLMGQYLDGGLTITNVTAGIRYAYTTADGGVGIADLEDAF